MTYERFREILREYNYDEATINDLWRTRPYDDLNELSLRKTAKEIKPPTKTI